MNKTIRRETSTRLLNRFEEITNQIDSISKYGRRHNLLTTEELKTLDKLELEYALLAIEASTFGADFEASRNPIKFLKRHILSNH